MFRTPQTRPCRGRGRTGRLRADATFPPPEAILRIAAVPARGAHGICESERLQLYFPPPPRAARMGQTRKLDKRRRRGKPRACGCIDHARHLRAPRSPCRPRACGCIGSNRRSSLPSFRALSPRAVHRGARHAFIFRGSNAVPVRAVQVAGEVAFHGVGSTLSPRAVHRGTQNCSARSKDRRLRARCRAVHRGENRRAGKRQHAPCPRAQRIDEKARKLQKLYGALSLRAAHRCSISFAKATPFSLAPRTAHRGAGLAQDSVWMCLAPARGA